MAKLSKTQLSNIVDDVVQEWGEEATIRNLSLQKITILRAYLNLYDALLSLPKNKDRDVKEKLHDKIDEIKPILGHLLDASISYCSIKTKTIKEKYINLNYTYALAYIIPYSAASVIALIFLPSFTFLYWGLGVVFIIVINYLVTKINSLFINVDSIKKASLEALESIESDCNDIIYYAKSKDIDTTDVSEKLNALLEAVKGFYTED